MKQGSRWYSKRVEQEIGLVRWGTWGQPVLVFPTAGGDAEEIERMHLVGALMPLIEAGRIKVYSCDNLAGRAFAARTGSLEYRCALLEPVPGLRGRGGGAGDPHRLPRRRRRGGGGGGLARGVHGGGGDVPLSVALPRGGGDERQLRPRAGVRVQGQRRLLFLHAHELPAQPRRRALLDILRRRFVLLAYGGGRWENPDDSWRLAGILGGKRCRTGSTPGGRSTTTTGRPGGRCCRSISNDLAP